MLNYSELFEKAQERSWKKAELLYPPDQVEKRSEKAKELTWCYYREMTYPTN